MTAYYNEIDPYAASELRKLIAAARIAVGDVDERSIRDVRADDLAGYTQCHFFAGIGGWSLALKLIGWPDDRPVWTGSCPCQPFSLAGKRRGFEDDRHLWPDWFRLIRGHCPPTVYGEQVAHATQWIRLVRADLEREQFAFASRKLRASDVGARHRRNRLWFVAYSDSEARRLQPWWRLGASGEDSAVIGAHGAAWPLADAQGVSERKPPDAAHAITARGKARSVACGYGQPLAYANSQPAIGTAITRPKCDPWRAEPAVGRVLDGIPHRLVEPALRAFGNAIVPQVAAEFIKASAGYLP